MSEEIRLSVEETNKLRAQLSLPLLPTSSPQPSNALSTERGEETRSKSINGNSTLSISETNKLRRSLGLRLLEEDHKLPDREFVTDTKQSSSLEDNKTNGKNESPSSQSGVRVSHSAKDLAQLKDGDVFTLEDRGILSEDDDCFVNETLQKQAKQLNYEREIRKIGAKHAHSAFYDEELDLEDELQLIQVVGSTITLPATFPKSEEPALDGHVTKISGLFDDLENTDKAKTHGSKVVKFKKSKAKSSSKKRSPTETLDTKISIASEMVTLAFALEDENFADLEEILTKSRSEKAKVRSRLSAEELAAEAKVNRRMDLIADLKEGLAFDGTDEFLGRLSSESNGDVTESKPMAADSPGIDSVAETAAIDNSSDIPKPDVPSLEIEQEFTKSNLETENTTTISEDDSLRNAKRFDASMECSSTDGPRLGGILASLKFLRQSAATTSDAEKKAYKMKRDKEKEQGLLRIKISIQERIVKEKLEKDPVYIRLTEEEKVRIYDRVLSDSLVSEGIIDDTPGRGRSRKNEDFRDNLAEYNPQVHVLHKDETGQVLDQKQAWKALSHRYHGLAPKNVKRAKFKSRSERTIA